MSHFLAGVGRALLFDPSTNALIGVAKTLTDSTFNTSITAEEVRGGGANALRGKYFHDSNLAVTLTDGMFDFIRVAANLGVNPQMGGLTVYESASAGDTAGAGTMTLTNTPVAFNGSLIGWYKKPGDTNWSIGNISGTTMTIAGAQSGDKYCVKYFYQNASAKSIAIKANYVPKVLHVVILADLFSGNPDDIGSSTKYGRLITDIPALQLDGTQELSLSSTSAASVSLTGNAIAVDASDSCEEEPYYGTITEEIYGKNWKDEVVGLAVEGGVINLSGVGTKETMVIRVVYGGNIASQRKENSNFTFALEQGNSVTVNATTGEITAASAGVSYVSATLTGYTDIAPAIAEVTVTV